MAVKIWNVDESGVMTSTIRTGNRSGIGGEELRPQAEELDAEIDRVLDEAHRLLTKEHGRGKSNLFAKRWAIGRAIANSRILESNSLEAGQRPDLWLAMARKCRIGVRHTGDRVKKWRGLIPDREMEPQRIESDIFGLAMWLQEQPLEEAVMAFGSGLHNAKNIWSGEALRSMKLRSALANYFTGFDQSQREILYTIPKYTTMAKALRKRWPSRGRGSAKRPVHYGQEELLEEMRKVMNPVVAELLGAAQNTGQHHAGFDNHLPNIKRDKVSFLLEDSHDQ